MTDGAYEGPDWDAVPDPDGPDGVPVDLLDAYAGPDWPGREVGRARFLVERIAERQSLATVFAAERLEFIDALRLQAEADGGATWTEPDGLGWRAFRAEVAAVLRVHERTAQAVIEFAQALVHSFPTTLAGLHRAEFTERHARILVEQSVGLPDELLGRYEARVLPWARTVVPSRLEVKARTIREQLNPADLVGRHREAVTRRRTAIEAAGDGMAWYGAYLPAQDAVGAAAAVTGIARTLMVDGETRCLAQVEADVFRDLLTDAAGTTLSTVAGGAGGTASGTNGGTVGGPASGPVPSPAARRGVRPEVLIHVPVLTVMGRSQEPGILDGYGPIDADTARRLAGTATGFTRILTDHDTGVPLSYGRTVYKVPPALRRYLALRDEVCRFVGCTRAAKYCDIDHTVPWIEDGETVAHNLAHLCRGHHRVKGGTRWRAAQSPGGNGTLTWTSPTGRVYTTTPAAPLSPPRSRNAKSPNPPNPPNRYIAQTHWLDTDDPPF